MSTLLQNPTRILFFTGKGGVGKTSSACATAIGLADAGKRVLLVSTDPASNLDEVLSVKLSPTPTAVPNVPGLSALNIDPVQAAHDYRERVVGPYRGVLPPSAVLSMEEQLSGACTVEIAAFNELRCSRMATVSVGGRDAGSQAAIVRGPTAPWPCVPLLGPLHPLTKRREVVLNRMTGRCLPTVSRLSIAILIRGIYDDELRMRATKSRTLTSAISTSVSASSSSTASCAKGCVQWDGMAAKSGGHGWVLRLRKTSSHASRRAT